MLPFSKFKSQTVLKATPALPRKTCKRQIRMTLRPEQKTYFEGFAAGKAAQDHPATVRFDLFASGDNSSRTSNDLLSDMQTERIEERGTSRTSSALPSDTQTDEFKIRDTSYTSIALPSDLHTGNEERNTLRTRNASPPDIQIGRVKELDNGVSEEQDEEQIDQMRNQEANTEARDDSSIYPEDYENDSSKYLEDDEDDDSRYSDEDASHTPTED